MPSRPSWAPGSLRRTSEMSSTVVVAPSDGRTREISPVSCSVTHRKPSGPQVISHGFPSPVASTRDEKDSVGAATARQLAPYPQHHPAPEQADEGDRRRHAERDPDGDIARAEEAVADRVDEEEDR